MLSFRLYPPNRVLIFSQPATRSLMNVMSSNVESHAPELSWTSRFYSFGSDHVPFQEAGIPCFLVRPLLLTLK